MQQQANSFCGKHTVVGPVRHGSGRIGYKRLRCRSLRCPHCRDSKAHRVRNRIAEIAGEKGLTKFVTLTLDPKRIPANIRSEIYLRDCWRKMRVSLTRRFGKSVDFISVLEFQKSGIAHLHLLIGVFIPQNWLSEAWQSVGGGRIVDIQYVDVHRVAAYLTQYFAGEKIAHTLSLLPRRARIFGSSRTISLCGKKEKRGWWIVKRGIEYLRMYANEVERERSELVDCVTVVVEKLAYFEAWLTSQATYDVDAFRILHSLATSRAT
jgi:hypothetical protein